MRPQLRQLAGEALAAQAKLGIEKELLNRQGKDQEVGNMWIQANQEAWNTPFFNRSNMSTGNTPFFNRSNMTTSTSYSASSFVPQNMPSS